MQSIAFRSSPMVSNWSCPCTLPDCKSSFPLPFLLTLIYYALLIAATDYSARLKDTFGEEGGDNCFPAFDAALLGMGPDGHTCSLFPGHPLLEEQQKWVAHIEDSPKPPPARITLTYPVLNCAQNVMFVGTGESKAALLPQLIKFSDPSGLHAAGAASPYPAARVEPLSGTLTYYVDAAAAAECPPEVKAAAQVL
ncbi:unnamed protein product [Choristocarpus tenellus]